MPKSKGRNPHKSLFTTRETWFGRTSDGASHSQYSQYSQQLQYSQRSNSEKKGWHYLLVCALIGLIFTSIYNLAFWRHMVQIYAVSQQLESSFKFLLPIALFCLLNALLVLLFSYKYIFKPIFCILFLLTCEVSYNAWSYGVIFDRDMIQNIVNTNVAEASSYASWLSILVFILGGILPCIILFKLKLYYPRFVTSMLQRLAIFVLSLVVLVGIVLFKYQDFAFILRNNHILRYEFQPIGYISATQSWIKHKYFNEPLPYVSLGDQAVRLINASDKPDVAFLVLGETARAANYSILGYGRVTNDFTSRDKVIALKNVIACGTSTAYSVPCMFSNLGRANYSSNKAESRDNILHVLQKAGIDVLWLENNGGCQGVCKNIKTINVNLEAKTNKQLCNGSTCYDEILLKYSSSILKDIKNDTFVVFHLIGSHGPRYYERYPEKFKRYTPDCNRPDVENCSAEEVINAYDNSILYTDYVISNLIKQLMEYKDQYNVSLMYISDHGESLGEGGLYLHGTPYAFAPKEQIEIPWIFWMDKNSAERVHLDIECMRKENFYDYKFNSKLSHDNLFHSLLGIMQIDTPEYNPDLNIFAKCMLRPQFQATQTSAVGKKPASQSQDISSSQ